MRGWWVGSRPDENNPQKRRRRTAAFSGHSPWAPAHIKRRIPLHRIISALDYVIFARIIPKKRTKGSLRGYYSH